MAAVMDSVLDRSPEDTDDVSEGDVIVDQNLLAEERELHKKRLEAEAAEQDCPVEEGDPEPEGGSGVGAKLLQLVGKSQLYSSWLADQFKDVVEHTLAVAAGGDNAEADERPAKRSRTGRGKQAATRAPTPTGTQRLLPLICAELRDYQLKGVAWLISLYKNGVNGILADEMGLGKTLQTIGFISYLWTNVKDTSTRKFMVVGPLSTLSNWVAEFDRFCPSIPVLLYHGTPQEREALRRTHMQQGGKDQMPVIVTSYEIVMADRRHLERHDWKLVVVDEGHRLKNFDCKLLRELRCLNMESRLLLTGTPLQNNLRELWSLLSFCMPQVFADANQFLDWFDIRTPATAIPAAVTAPATNAPDASATSHSQPKKRVGRPRKNAKPAAAQAQEAVATAAEGGERGSGAAADGAGTGGSDSGSDADRAAASGADSKTLGTGAGGAQSQRAADMVSRLHAILKPFVLRRVKADVSIGVPPKQEVVLYADMSDEQRRLTRGLIDGTLKEELAKEAVPGARTNRLNNLIMQMRKVCNHPDLITGPASGSTMFPPALELVAQCGKLALLDRLLRELLREDHRVLIFSQMTEVLNVLEAYLEDLGIKAARLDGSVPWQQRKQDIAEFQAGTSDKRVFLLSTRAGGLGINLTAADTVIIYDSDWNPHQDSQAMDRCHRIGQTRPVLVFRLVTSNSVENRMLAKAESKKALERIVIKKGAFKELTQSTSSTSVEELVQLLNPDRRSGDLAQSGVVSDEMLHKLLDRSHLVTKATPDKPDQDQGQGKGKAQRKDKGSTGKGRVGPAPKGPSAADGDPSAGAAGAQPMPPYPLVGVGYEVVMDEPRRAVGLLQTIEGDEGSDAQQ